MEDALELARAKDTKERMAGVERLHQFLETSRKSLSSSEVTSLVDICLDLLKDANFRVSQGALQALDSAAVLSGEHLKLHFNALVPAVVERLGDGKQPVRDAARRLLLTLMEVSSPTIIVERAGSYAWAHKSWRVREEFVRTVTSAIGLFASTELPLQRAILPPILQMLNDPNLAVREAAILCIEEMYNQVGPQFRDELQRHSLSALMAKDINVRLEKIVPKIRSSEGLVNNYSASEIKPLNPKKSSPKAKSSTREVSLFGGDGDITEKPVEPIKVYSEKELVREFEKIASTLVPDKDWSIRIAAMQRVEGLVIGGATDYSCFRGLLKQLVGPLSSQLSDRRSSIVKQACHLVSFLSKELLGDFEACAELFIPVLFKLVVITVLVIAESADNCIKTMLRNCKVSRVLPRIVDSAKNDRSAILRARCCEYALLILEYWADAPEIQRSAEVYEDLIKCCVADAMSEVRSTARTCYRMFSRTWPDRSRRLFMSFDPVIQRIIHDEDGGIHRRHASPSIRERSSTFTSHTSTPTLPGYGTSAIVAMDRSANLSSGTSLSSGLLLSQVKSAPKGSERTLESVLNASKEKVSAIESMLRGLNLSEKSRSSSLDLGVDPPSSRDPPFPLAVPASNSLANSLSLDTSSSMSKVSNHNGGLVMSDIISQIQASRDSGRLSYRSGVGSEPLSLISSYSAKRSEKLQETGLMEENADFREARRFMNSHVDRHYTDTPYRDGNLRDSHNNHIPNFQKPLLRKNVAGRMSAVRRRSFDDSQLSLGDMSTYVEGPTSLNEALSEGLSSSSDWNARVAAFNYLRTLLQQGSRGIQEIVQSFEKVMKLFFQHLDDPHHKVAQAALSTLADLIPACRKPFESYIERMLPHVFSRLIDPKELVRQPCSNTLETVSKTYGTDSLLPALLRSLDEQRSPKAKLAVIEFAIGSFNKHASNSEGSGNGGILKLWLSKLMPLVHDKNTKLKEAAITCIISVYTHFDSVAVLNFILSLSVEEQNSLRRALKQHTPRIEVDLMNFLQNKKERRPKSSYDPSDVVGTSSEEGYIGGSKKGPLFGRYSSGSIDSDGGRKWSSAQELATLTGSMHQTSDDIHGHSYISETGSNNDVLTSNAKDLKYMASVTTNSIGPWTSRDRFGSMESTAIVETTSTPRLDLNGLIGDNHQQVNASLAADNGPPHEFAQHSPKLAALTPSSASEMGPSIPQILHLIGNGNDENSTNKCNALQQLVEVSVANSESIWSKYFNQILTVVLEVLDDSDSSIRELALSLIVEMLKSQKHAMEESIEIVIEKLLHVTKDIIPKVSNEAEHCLTIVLAQMLQSLEWEPSGSFYQKNEVESRENGTLVDHSAASGLIDINLAVDLTDPSLPPNPRKSVLHRPSATQLIAVIATVCEELPMDSVVLLYLSAAGQGGSSPTVSSGSSRKSSKTSHSYQEKNSHVHENHVNGMGDSSHLFENGLWLGPGRDGGPNSLYPGDIIPFTRRPIFLIVDSDNSHAFKVLHGAERGETPAIFLSPMRPSFKNPTDTDLMNSGSQFTFFLTAPLMAFCQLVGLTLSDYDVDVFRDADNIISNSFSEWELVLCTSTSLHLVWAQVLSDHFLRRLILRFIFCRAVLTLFCIRESSDQYLPICLPEFPNSLCPTSEVVQSAVFRLAKHLKVQKCFEANGTN